jgi:hypothetical protein
VVVSPAAPTATTTTSGTRSFLSCSNTRFGW